MTGKKRNWTLFDACSIAEGFCGGEDATGEKRHT